MGPSSLVAVEVLSFSAGVEEGSFLVAEVVLSCPLMEGAEVVVGVSSPYLTPHANNWTL